MATMRRKLRNFVHQWKHSNPRKVFMFSLIAGLCATSIPLGWQVGTGTLDTIRGWIGHKPSVMASPLPIATVAPASLNSRDPLDELFESETAEPETTGRSKSSGETNTQDGNALAIETHRLQQMEIELSATRRQLADTQWNLVISRGQAVDATADRDRALQQVDDLTRQLRENLLELNAAQKSIADLQRRSGSSRLGTPSRPNQHHPHGAQLTAKN